MDCTNAIILWKSIALNNFNSVCEVLKAGTTQPTQRLILSIINSIAIIIKQEQSVRSFLQQKIGLDLSNNEK